MPEYLTDLNDNEVISCDVAIVGAGAAGLTLARTLSGSALTVCVFESGGMDFDQQSQALAAGENTGDRYYDLIDSRLRFFGGTTAIWGGRCARYDAHDFERREWVQDSGWPISLADVEPYYTRATKDFELGDGAAAASAWQDGIGERLGFDQRVMTTGRWRFDDVAERFSSTRQQDLFATNGLRMVLHANLVDIEVNDNANTVTGLQFANKEGQRTRVTARSYVLACGGIDNARVLLASNSVQPNGIGNDSDCVGRYFMEHPHGRVGIMEAGKGFELWSAFQRRSDAEGRRVAPVLLPSAGVQRERELLNSALTFKLQRDPARGLAAQKKLMNQLKHQLAPTQRARSMWHGYRALRKFVQRTVRKPLARAKFNAGKTRVNVMVRAEQAPNRESRVFLASETDRFGIPLANLHWRLSSQDKHTVRELGRLLDAELQRLGLGSLALSDWLHESSDSWPVDETVGNHPIAGYHHIGTTRMSESATSGVVDRDCRVHGYDNLYIAGSSVFPTASWANPTFTIVALAHRLADKLLEDLK